MQWWCLVIFTIIDQKKNIICGVGNNPWKAGRRKRTSREDLEKEYGVGEDSLEQERLVDKEDLWFQEEIEVQRFVLEELMNKIEQSISEQIVRRVKERLNTYMRLVPFISENKNEELKEWVANSTSQEVFVCFSIMMAKKLKTFKGHSKDFVSFENFLDNKIGFLASLYSTQNLGEKPVSPKFLHLLCFLSR